MVEQKVSSGGSIGGSPLRKAAFVNSLIDTVENFKLRELGGAPDIIRARTHTDVIKVRNVTGAQRRFGDCLEVGEAIIDRLNPRRLWFDGDAPGTLAGRPVGILLRQAAPRTIVPLQLSGVCVAFVDVTDIAHTHADSSDGLHVLQSATAGPFRLLSIPTVVGEQGCAVLLNRAFKRRCQATVQAHSVSASDDETIVLDYFRSRTGVGDGHFALSTGQITVKHAGDYTIGLGVGVTPTQSPATFGMSIDIRINGTASTSATPPTITLDIPLFTDFPGRLVQTWDDYYTLAADDVVTAHAIAASGTGNTTLWTQVTIEEL